FEILYPLLALLLLGGLQVATFLMGVLKKYPHEILMVCIGIGQLMFIMQQSRISLVQAEIALVATQSAANQGTIDYVLFGQQLVESKVIGSGAINQCRPTLQGLIDLSI